MEQIFFRALFALLNDKQVVKITTTRVGDNLTLLINKDNKLITMTGNPEEVDNGIINHLKVNTVPTEQSFNVTVTDAPEGDAESDEKKSSAPAKKKADGKKKPAPAKTPKPAKTKVEKKVKEIKEKADDHVAETEAKKEKLKEFTERMDLGKRAMELGNFDEAIKVYELAMQVAPEGNNKAADQMEKAKQALQKHLDTEKQKEFDALMESGKKLREERKYEESLDAFKKAEELFPKHPEVEKQILNAQKWIKMVKELEAE